MKSLRTKKRDTSINNRAALFCGTLQILVNINHFERWETIELYR